MATFKRLQAKSLNRSDLKTVVGGIIWNDERGTNVEDRRCGRKYGAPPCKDSHDLMK